MTHDTQPSNPTPILIAGATASGKSALALALTEACGGVVINADSMQVYRELPILTAQPSADEQARAPHRLYGHVPAREAYSTGRYVEDVRAALAEIAAAGQRPIIVGGTGLYFKALLEGLSPVPPIPPEIRTKYRDLLARFDAYTLWRMLEPIDPVVAHRIDLNDGQRIVRALEVHEATGRPLSAWQTIPGVPLLDEARCIKLRIDRPREELRARCDRRFDLMMEAGALDEVRAVVAQDLSTELPAMRALGVAPLAAFLRGEFSREAAAAQAKLETGQYVKRQETWLKRNMIAWKHISTQQMENSMHLLASIVDLND